MNIHFKIALQPLLETKLPFLTSCLSRAFIQFASMFNHFSCVHSIILSRSTRTYLLLIQNLLLHNLHRLSFFPIPFPAFRIIPQCRQKAQFPLLTVHRIEELSLLSVLGLLNLIKRLSKIHEQSGALLIFPIASDTESTYSQYSSENVFSKPRYHSIRMIIWIPQCCLVNIPVLVWPLCFILVSLSFTWIAASPWKP